MIRRSLLVWLASIPAAGFAPCAAASSYADFFSAVANDRPDVVQSLLQRGFDPDTRDEQGQVGLFLALRAGSLKVAQVLLDYPKTDIEVANEAGETPLMMAALRDQPDFVRQLIARGASVNRSGWTPLHYAATSPGVAAMDLLLAKGAAIDARSPNGTTPLMMACRYGPEAAVDLLLARGADAKGRNERAMTAADFARSSGRNFLVERLDRAAGRP
jgi:ankyrin repeat protein